MAREVEKAKQTVILGQYDAFCQSASLNPHEGDGNHVEATKDKSAANPSDCTAGHMCERRSGW